MLKKASKGALSMSKRGDREFLYDILEACRRIEEYSKGMNYEDFRLDYEKQDAVIRNIEIIGEAVKNISEGLKNQHRDIQWRKIAGMRDKLIHSYFGIDLEIMWIVIRREIPTLKEKISEILKKLGDER